MNADPKLATLVLLTSYDPFTLAAIELIAVRQQAEGRQVVILDVTQVTAAISDSYEPHILRACGIRTPRELASFRFKEQGMRLIRVRPQKRLLETVPPEFQQDIDDAIHSAQITYLRDHVLDVTSIRIRRLTRRQNWSVAQIFTGLTYVLQSMPQVRRIFVPNGRFPEQRIVQLEAKRRGLDCQHYERGEPPAGVYLQPYSPQDRIASQRSTEDVLRAHTELAITQAASNWLSRRSVPGSSVNPFAQGWSIDARRQVGQRADQRMSRVGLFTSSQDEFVHLGSDWQMHSWSDQFAAFDYVLSEFRRTKDERDVYLRVHPNLITKSHRYFNEEKRSILRLGAKYPELEIYWHDDPTSSYQLLENTDICFVWDSTIGLEASARGISVWTLAKSRYGDVADVRELLSPNAEPGLFSPWRVDRDRAMKFAAYLVLRDVQLTTRPSDFKGWPDGDEPWIVKISRLLCSGGYASRRQVAMSILDIYRNRGLVPTTKGWIQALPRSAAQSITILSRPNSESRVRSLRRYGPGDRL